MSHVGFCLDYLPNLYKAPNGDYGLSGAGQAF